MSTVTSGPSRAPKVFLAIGALLLVLVIALATFLSDDASSREVTPSPTATTTPPPATAAPAASSLACEPAYAQAAVGNEGGKVIDDFETRYATATTEANNLSDAQQSLLIEQSGTNAQTLAAWAHAFGLYEDPNNWQPLIDGNCLSAEGQKLHNQFEGALSATGSKFEEASAPADGFNSGISDGVYGVSSSAGIRGDRKAVKVTLSDGTVAYVMVRCGNPVYPAKPNLPEVPTDNPPPPVEKPPVAPPPVKPPPVQPPPVKPPVDTPKCPWNPALPPDSPKCLQPKSSNPDRKSVV